MCDFGIIPLKFLALIFLTLETNLKNVGYQMLDKKLKNIILVSQVILGVDRLDYTKGLVARLKALEHMFTAYPYWIGKVAMLQVC